MDDHNLTAAASKDIHQLLINHMPAGHVIPRLDHTVRMLKHSSPLVPKHYVVCETDCYMNPVAIEDMAAGAEEATKASQPKCPVCSQPLVNGNQQWLKVSQMRACT